MPIGALGAGLISGAAQVGSGLFGMIGGLRAAKKQREANMELAKYSYSQDLNMWNMQNLYNSPSEQMSRLDAAGLNPNLVYGTGTVGNTSGPPPKFNTPEAPYFAPKMDVPDVLGRAMDFQMRQAQVDNLQAQTQNTKVRTENESLRSVLLSLSGRTGEAKLQQMQTLFPYEADIMHGRSQEAYPRLMEQFQKTAQAGQKTSVGQPLEFERQRLDNVYKSYENKLREIGVNSSDNLLLRVIIQLAAKMGISIGDVIEQFR